MTNQSHPITPATELLRHWEDQHFEEGENYDVMLIQAYQAGADQELEACCEWAKGYDTEHWSYSESLRTNRRPKPPSLKQEALIALIDRVQRGGCEEEDFDTIRRALELLPDDTTH